MPQQFTSLKFCQNLTSIRLFPIPLHTAHLFGHVSPTPSWVAAIMSQVTCRIKNISLEFILFPFQSISQQMDAVDWVSISDVLARPQFSSLNKFDVCFKCNQSISHSSWSVLERVIREDLLSSIDTRGVLHVTFIMSQ